MHASASASAATSPLSWELELNKSASVLAFCFVICECAMSLAYHVHMRVLYMFMCDTQAFCYVCSVLSECSVCVWKGRWEKGQNVGELACVVAKVKWHVCLAVRCGASGANVERAQSPANA